MDGVPAQQPPRQRSTPPPPAPADPIEIDPPPARERPAPGGGARALLVLPVLVGLVAMMLMLGRGGGAHTYLVGGMFGVSALAMLVTGWTSLGAPGRGSASAARRDYRRYLDGMREQVRDAARRQRAAAHYHHPAPGALWSLVDGARRWERRPADPEFGHLRVGVGTRPLATPLRPVPARDRAEPDPVAAAARQRFVAVHAQVAHLPVTLLLTSLRRISVTGDAEAVAGLARAVLAQLATFHPPAAVRVAVCAGAGRRDDWEWIKWLPHAGHPDRTDAVGPVRLVAGSPAQLLPLVRDLPAGSPHLLVVRDRAGAGPLRLERAGLTVLDLSPGDGAGPPESGEVRLEITDRLRVRSGDLEDGYGVPDQLTVSEAEALARRLAGAVPSRDGWDSGDPGPPAPGPAILPGGGDPHRFDPATAWLRRPVADQLRVPIGTGEDGAPVWLDLKESAVGGMGPHGLLVGATGSGKSELLRTVVLGLAAGHASSELNLVLIDFKGGATFAALGRLPHTAAVITNLADALPLVDRMADALNGELVRRQEVLRRAGAMADRAGYEQARAGGAALAPLPSLLVVCDEFAELLAARPDLVDLFGQIGRVGRSLGVHLLLASQRLEEGRLRGLDAHLSYRIGLRTFSALESRTVLGVPDAYELPPSPGHGYLKPGTGGLVRFQAGFVSGPCPGEAQPEGPPPVRILPFGTRPVPSPATRAIPSPSPGVGPTTPSLLEVLVDRMAAAGPPAHQVWLPPLDQPPLLDDLLGPVARHPEHGLVTTDPLLRNALRVPVAVVDQPFQQRREPLWLALDGAGGHVAIAGGPRSGKSSLLATLICGLALTHTPAQVQVYCLDFGGGQLARLRDLPHVGGVAGRHEPAAVRRTVAELAMLQAERERRGGDRTGDGFGEVFLVVDGWATLRAEFEILEAEITALAVRGLSYGIHLVASAARWLEFRPAVRDLFGSRLELRLGDPADSIAGLRAAERVPGDVPGRGITADGLHLLTALPRLAGRELVAEAAAAWSGPPAPPVRLLPELVPYSELAPSPMEGAAALRLPVGLAEADLRPVAVDFAADSHLLVFGDAECGKSSFLRALATSVTRRFPPERARLVLVDYRRSLLGVAGSEHVIGYGTAAGPATELMESVGSYLRERLPGPDVTRQQLRQRSWWHGPECFVLVDDYDLISGGDNPLLPLLPYLAQARDVGLHVVLARRCGGAARAMYEPVLQRLRELAAASVVMSGDPDEGALVGQVRPEPMPPGRGRLVTRGQGVRLIQLAHLPDAVESGVAAGDAAPVTAQDAAAAAVDRRS